ncbi:hypothetical protein L3X38_026864 [Prunus dulcis]|uniref:Uncharacterized protein n=1 Tax=Prunus dulcis TaxID=3755 RepID=A0AAD4VLZ4_PRUDU|nr:hypothetical protein L3X38_026864 [Prunus dulcis]
MRHPTNWEAWKEFDRTFPEFDADPRNVRLRLATNGFNPYGVLNQHHSTWPNFVFPYNLPPWKCMKKEYMMLTEDPSRSIDVNLRPLVDELKDLWTNGVRTYDKSTGNMFTLQAAVMWTVNDFPAYAMDQAARTFEAVESAVVTVESAAENSSVFTDSSPASFSLLRPPNPTPQAPVSSASSVAHPVSARRRHPPASTTDTTSIDATGVSGSQPGIDFLQL